MRKKNFTTVVVFIICLFVAYQQVSVVSGYHRRYTAQVKAIPVPEKKAPKAKAKEAEYTAGLVPDYLIPLSKILKCAKMKDCQEAMSKMVETDVTKFLELVDKNVDLKKSPKSFKDSIDKLRAAVNKAIQQAKDKAKAVAEKQAKEKTAKAAKEAERAKQAPVAAAPTKNPCPIVREVQFEPIPPLPQPTKLCFGANGTSTIEEVVVKMVLAPKKSLQLPQYFFRTSIDCSSGQTAAVKPDGSGLECVSPGASQYEFTYNYCPSGFQLIPKPEDGEKPKFCFGHLPILNAYVVWIYNAPSSSYAGLPESEFGVNKQCAYSEGWARVIDKTAASIECDYKTKALYPLPNRYSVIFPMPTLDGSTTSTPHADQGSAAVECFKGAYGKPFNKVKTHICRLFKSG